MFILTMTSPISRASLSVEEIKNITNLTQWMFSIFQFHLFLLDSKKTISFINRCTCCEICLFLKVFFFYLLKANEHTQTNPNAQTLSQPQPSSHPTLIFSNKKKNSLARITINSPTPQTSSSLQLYLLVSFLPVVILLTFSLMAKHRVETIDLEIIEEDPSLEQTLTFKRTNKYVAAKKSFVPNLPLTQVLISTLSFCSTSLLSIFISNRISGRNRLVLLAEDAKN